VVGAGPIGSTVSRWIAEKGFSVLLVEEHGQIGHPNHCAGLITPRTLKLAGLYRDGLVQNELKGAIIRSVSRRELSIGGDKIHALAVNRPLLDAKLAQEAEEAGVQLLLGTRAFHFERQGKIVRIHLDSQVKDGIVETKLLIGADGVRSSVSRWARLPGPDEVIKAINARVRLPDCTPDLVEVFLGHSLAPGWFAWIIPLGDGEARLGIGTTQGAPARYLKELMAAFPRRFQSVEILNVSGGLIPLGLPRQIYADNIMLVGDAACQVKPTSGGGVYTGLRAARSCARTAIHALQRDDLSAESLRRYHAAWLEQMGDELRLGLLLRRIFARLEDDDFDRLLHLASDQKTHRMISKYGDMDYPSRLLAQLVSAFPGWKTLSSLGIGIANMGMTSPDKWVKHVIAILRASK
jgi:digeranylgeranylglycerophospholipid reductase